MHYLIALVTALFFSYIFYDSNGIGLNWLLFLLVIVTGSYISTPTLNNQRVRLLGAFFVLANGFAMFWHPSAWVLLVCLISMAYLIGASHMNTAVSPFVALINAASRCLLVPIAILKDVFQPAKFLGARTLWVLRHAYLLIPTLIALGFILIYSAANPWFNEALGWISELLERIIRFIHRHIDAQWMALFILGSILSAYAFIPAAWRALLSWSENQSEFFKRERIMASSNQPKLSMGLKREWRSAVLLFALLNALILLLNVLDIIHVWIGFEWNGQYLKQFVHEGTWLLVFSILVSIALVLYYYRGNLNFYKSKLLQQLTFVWLAQNAFLVFSVVRRNAYYIEYYNLAYKRIAVLFFLLLVLYGLYTVMIKVKQRRSFSYLLNHNSLAVLIVLTLSAAISWDPIIARFNMKRADVAYVHYDFLAQMDLSAMPYLDLSLERLKEIEMNRNQKFPEEPSYMSAEEFYWHQQDKMSGFIERHKEQSWKAWNIDDFLISAYIEERIKTRPLQRRDVEVLP